ncbi:uncharacterized protein LOC127240203 isoform X2 [Andrographis paniculata]|nr:uncharacterized protein LOC127240203 isoform X2 [Andrographis paniculata]
MPGKWAGSNFEAADIYTTKIGGLPDWPSMIVNERQDLLECNTCRNKLSLLAQVYAPLSSKSSEVERIVYVFCCLVPDCQSLSWRALRIQKILSNETVHCPTVSISNSEKDGCSFGFIEGDAMEGEDEDDIDLEQLQMAFSQAANISPSGKMQNNDGDSSKKHRLTGHPARSVNDKTPVMPCFYIYSQAEKLSKQVTPKTFEGTLSSLQECKSNSEDNSDGETYEEENYEYDRALNADRTYLKFKKRMDANPEQCFRYSHGGKPLLASAEVGDPGICTLCGGARHYEMQLMPPVIYFLQEIADKGQMKSLEKFDWMTLLIYTCSKSCTGLSQEGKLDGEDWMIAEETVIAQCE